MYTTFCTVVIKLNVPFFGFLLLLTKELLFKFLLLSLFFEPSIFTFIGDALAVGTGPPTVIVFVGQDIKLLLGHAQAMYRMEPAGAAFTLQPVLPIRFIL